MYRDMIVHPQCIHPYRYSYESHWCLCTLHSHRKHGLYRCIHRHLQAKVFGMMMIKVMVIRMILVADGDLLSMMLAMNYFGLILFLSDNKKYLHNIVLDLFPFASDTSV